MKKRGLGVTKWGLRISQDQWSWYRCSKNTKFLLAFYNNFVSISRSSCDTRPTKWHYIINRFHWCVTKHRQCD